MRISHQKSGIKAGQAVLVLGLSLLAGCQPTAPTPDSPAVPAPAGTEASTLPGLVAVSLPTEAATPLHPLIRLFSAGIGPGGQAAFVHIEPTPDLAQWLLRFVVLDVPADSVLQTVQRPVGPRREAIGLAPHTLTPPTDAQMATAWQALRPELDAVFERYQLTTAATSPTLEPQVQLQGRSASVRLLPSGRAQSATVGLAHDGQTVALRTVEWGLVEARLAVLGSLSSPGADYAVLVLGRVQAATDPEAPDVLRGLTLIGVGADVLPDAPDPPSTPPDDVLAQAATAVSLRAGRDRRGRARVGHPRNGLTFLPYPLATGPFQRFSAEALPALASDSTLYVWGYGEYSDEPFALSFEAYYDTFIYAFPFAETEAAVLRPVSDLSSTLPELFPGGQVATYSWRAAAGGTSTIWRELNLVFQPYNGGWALAAVIHQERTTDP
ncbi:MAG: hypothetical protein AAF970_16535 [Bacteroidota bacterium]